MNTQKELDYCYTSANKEFRNYLNLLQSFSNDVDNVLSWGYPIKSGLELDKGLRDILGFNDIDGNEKFRYGYGYGLDESSIKENIALYENMVLGSHYSNKDIIISQSSSYSINRILETLFWKLGVDGNLLIIAPTFFRMLNKLQYVPGINKIDVVSGKQENDFALNREEFENNIKKSKVVFMCNPVNPTYKFMTNEDINFVFNLCSKYGVYLVIDETGDALGEKGISYPKNILDSELIIRMRSFSKTHLLAENRLGLVISRNQVFLSNLKEVIGDDMSNVSFSSHDAINYIFKSELEKNYTSSYHRNKLSNISKLGTLRDETIKNLTNISGIENIIIPDTCFNVLVKFDSNRYKTDMDLGRDMLLNHGTAIAPGGGFGINPKSKHFRITYAVEEAMLESGLNILKKLLG